MPYAENLPDESYLPPNPELPMFSILSPEEESIAAPELEFLLLSTLNMLREVINQPSGDYEFFVSPGEREELYLYCLELSKYILANEIENVVLMDRAARPIYTGLRECLKALGGFKSEQPQIYFINPKGFTSKELANMKDEKKSNKYYAKVGDIKEKVKDIRPLGQVRDDFRDTYAHLISRSDKPTLIFDTCIHSGTAAKKVAPFFGEKGFTDIHLGVVHDAGTAPVVPDLSIIPIRPLLGCRPFHLETTVDKTYGSVHSQKSKDPEAIKNGIKLRREVRRVVRECLDADGFLLPEKALQY